MSVVPCVGCTVYPLHLARNMDSAVVRRELYICSAGADGSKLQNQEITGNDGNATIYDTLLHIL